MNENLGQLIDPPRRLMYSVLLDQRCDGVSIQILSSKCDREILTASSSNGLHIVVCDIIVDPREVRVRLLGRIRGLQILQTAPDHAIAEQARQQGNLQRQPVLRLSYVEDVAAVCRAGCEKIRQSSWLECYERRPALPWLSSCLSISSCVSPNSLHSLMCRLISCLICVTIAAP